MAKIVSVGPDEYEVRDDQLPDGCVWCVYQYERGDWEGSGEAFAFDGSRYWEKGLGHCSCYGPFDFDGHQWSPITRAELFEMHLAGDRDIAVKIKAAIAELEPTP